MLDLKSHHPSRLLSILARPALLLGCAVSHHPTLSLTAFLLLARYWKLSSWTGGTPDQESSLSADLGKRFRGNPVDQ